MTVTVPSSDPQNFYFKVDGEIVHAMGMTAAEAAKRLGLDPDPIFLDWATEQEAKNRKWI